MNPFQVTMLVLSCLALVFALSFFTAAVFTFATFDQKPLDRETDKMLSRVAGFDGGRFIYLFVVTRYWHQCALGRRFFYVGGASGVFGVVVGACNAYWS